MSRSDTETPERPQQHPVATILRSRGFVPLPRLWVRSRDMPTINAIAGQYREEVNAVRAQVGAWARAQTQVQAQTKQDAPPTGRGADPKPDPKTDKDATWETHLSSRITDEFHDAFKGAPGGK